MGTGVSGGGRKGGVVRVQKNKEKSSVWTQKHPPELETNEQVLIDLRVPGRVGRISRTDGARGTSEKTKKISVASWCDHATNSSQKSGHEPEDLYPFEERAGC